MPARILIVDDEAEIRDMLCRHFEFMGYDVDSAARAMEALEKLQAQRTEVVISDIVMPGIDGVDLLKIIRNLYPMTHVIMITGHVTLDHALACMRRGADTCVFKPLADMGELEEAVGRAIEDLRRWQEKFHLLKAMAPTAQEVHRAG